MIPIPRPVYLNVATAKWSARSEPRDKDKYNSAWMRREADRSAESAIDLLWEMRSGENCPPNYPPREVFLVLKLKFYTKIFAL
jgi:hypothetical protein